MKRFKQTIITFLLHVLQRSEENPSLKYIPGDNFCWSVAKTPFSANLQWRKGMLSVLPEWYEFAEHGDMHVKIDNHHMRFYKGNEMIMEKNNNNNSSCILETRLMGKPGSLFVLDFPDGIDISKLGHVVFNTGTGDCDAEAVFSSFSAELKKLDKEQESIMEKILPYIFHILSLPPYPAESVEISVLFDDIFENIMIPHTFPLAALV